MLGHGAEFWQYRDGKLALWEAALAGDHRESPQGASSVGSYQSLDQGDRYQVKRNVVKQGGRLSLQLHHRGAEHWVVVRGTARVTIGDKV